MRNPTTLVLAVACLAAAALPAGAQDAPKPPQQPATPPAPLQPWEFPREFLAAGRKMRISEPTLLEHDRATGDVKLRFPAQLTDGAGRLSWGAVHATGKAHIDFPSRLVLVDGLTATDSVLPQLPDDNRDEIAQGAAAGLPKELILRLELLTAAPGAAPPEPQTSPRLSMSAPEIIVRRTPAILVQVDGEPVLEFVEDFPLRYVLNTASNVFHDPKSDTWYLLADGTWLEAKKLEGPWKAGGTPVVLSQIKVTHPRGHVRMHIPGTPENAQRTGGKKAASAAPLPEVIVRQKPAELVVLQGDPLYLMVPGVKLMVVANTESDVLYHPKSERHYLLLSGRWYEAEEVVGPWKETVGGLPEEFTKIPRDHVRGHVTWCVPGTPEANEAAVLATLEERATLAVGTGIEVKYDGKEIQTLALEGTPIKVVTNTEDDVFQVDGAYWCCTRGAWFRSEDGRGGWTVTPTIPAALAEIPETATAYHARFCRAYGKGEAGIVFGVTGPFSGVFLWKGAPIHGSGYSRRGLLRDGNWYPVARTFGENRWYDPIAGVFQPRTVRYGPEMKAVADEWSPYTASYGRVVWYASRYDQGGRRMFRFGADTGRFDLAAGRPDPFEAWGTQLKERDGMKFERLPLGDRTAETPPKEPAVVVDEKGRVFRVGAKGLETWKDAQWAPAEKCGDLERKWLETFARIDARPEQLRAWAERRRAALPVNPTLTK